MEITHSGIDAYCENHSSPESELKAKLNRETHVNVMKPRMLSGHLQGNLLSILSKLIRPKFILEIGTYTGYSALCLAEGLQNDGKLITVDVNEELEEMCARYFQQHPNGSQIDHRIGEASEIIPTLKEPFDLVFIDADKASYWKYFEMVIDQMPIGGIILADNVLWSGKILEDHKDKDTVALKAFNKSILEDDRVENLIIPIRDGINVIRKIK